MLFSIAAIKAANKDNGKTWFGEEEMRLFKSKVVGRVYPVPGGALFITSEIPPGQVVCYSIRECDELTGNISTINDRLGYRSSESAHTVAKEISEDRNGE